MIELKFTPEGNEEIQKFYSGVLVKKDGNDFLIDELVDLVRTFFLALGYHPKTVEEAFGDGTETTTAESNGQDEGN